MCSQQAASSEEAQEAKLDARVKIGVRTTEQSNQLYEQRPARLSTRRIASSRRETIDATTIVPH
jgi:hypothetical protein